MNSLTQTLPSHLESQNETGCPPLETAPGRLPFESTFRTWDGTELFYRAWLPEPRSDRALILLHRGHEHSGRLQDVVDDLGLDETAIFAWDARGHGHSPGLRGHAPSFGAMVRDADHFVHHVSEAYGVPIDHMMVLGHSVGAVVAAAWVHDYAPEIRGLVLATPALRVKMYVPLAVPGLRLLHSLRGGRATFIKSYVKSRLLTHDAAQAERYDRDPLISREIAVNVLLGMHDTATRLLRDAGAIRVPTLMLTGGNDWVVRLKAQTEFFRGLGASHKTMRVFPKMYHDILHERDRQQVLDEARVFMQDLWREDASPQRFLHGDRQGHTHDEFMELVRPLTKFSAKWWQYQLSGLALRTVGRLSDGIRLGFQEGFDSGRMLDYVYENRAQGRWGIGALIDRIYLEGPGWKGIRQRKVHLEKLIQVAIARHREEARSIRLLDIAAGPGRYLLETLSQVAPRESSAVLRDYRSANIRAGQELAKTLGLDNTLDNITFEQADAFEARSYENLNSPNIAIVSGLYELFPDNPNVARSLQGLATAMTEGGYLIYTNQPWHPQLELIARLLPNREGQPWIMRRRTQKEMDDLVRAAGFRKIAMEIGEEGLFTVSLAQFTPSTPAPSPTAPES